MFGDVIDTIIQVLRASDVAKRYKMSVVSVSSDETQVVNTVLPAIAVGVDDSDRADVFIGGAVKDRIDLKISVMVDMSNYAWSKDRSFQADLISLGHGVRNAIETARTKGAFDRLTKAYDFSPMYRGFKTYQRIQMRKEFQSEIAIAEVLYSSTLFDKELIEAAHPKTAVNKVEIKCPYQGQHSGGEIG